MVAVIFILAVLVVIPLLSLVWGVDSRPVDRRRNWPIERQRRA
jgi:hypothetical protein